MSDREREAKDEFDRLETAAEEARYALHKHKESAFVVWSEEGAGDAGGTEETAAIGNPAWWERYAQLKAEADRADSAVDDYFDRMKRTQGR